MQVFNLVLGRLDLLLIVAECIFIWLSRSVELSAGYHPDSMAIPTGVFAIIPIIGGLIAAKQSRSPYGWI